MAYETPKWRTLWLLVGFGLLIGIGVVTVLLPELQGEPESEIESEEEPSESFDPQE
jgi:hypothetical protein